MKIQFRMPRVQRGPVSRRVEQPTDIALQHGARAHIHVDEIAADVSRRSLCAKSPDCEICVRPKEHRDDQRSQWSQPERNLHASGTRREASPRLPKPTHAPRPGRALRSLMSSCTENGKSERQARTASRRAIKTFRQGDASTSHAPIDARSAPWRIDSTQRRRQASAPPQRAAVLCVGAFIDAIFHARPPDHAAAAEDCGGTCAAAPECEAPLLRSLMAQRVNNTAPAITNTPAIGPVLDRNS